VSGVTTASEGNGKGVLTVFNGDFLTSADPVSDIETPEDEVTVHIKTINDNNQGWIPEMKIKRITGAEILPEVNDVIDLNSEDVDSEAKSNQVAFNIFQTLIPTDKLGRPYDGIVPEKYSLMNSNSRIVNLFSTKELRK
jgi:hypothetical protein